jgi:KDO2-lipid IV(A) lauroyltransferase
MILESIKGFYLNEADIRKRVTYLKPEFYKEIQVVDRPVILLMGHFLNWEWILMSLPLHIRNSVIILYKKVKNPHLNGYLTEKREKFGSQMAFIDETRNYFERYTSENAVFVLGADQSPTNLKNAIWTEFMNQETAFIHGPKKYAEKYSMAICYLHVSRVKRGHFQTSIQWLSEIGSDIELNTLLNDYVDLLEADIKRDPSNWLWSHRRWKRKRNELNPS